MPGAVPTKCEGNSQFGLTFARGFRGVEQPHFFRVTIPDVGPNGVLGSGDGTVLFTKAYATGNSAWVPCSSLTEPLIFALGNPVRFQFESLDAGGAGNFLDDCDFGTDVVSTPTALTPLTTGTTQQINTQPHTSSRKARWHSPTSPTSSSSPR